MKSTLQGVTKACSGVVISIESTFRGIVPSVRFLMSVRSIEMKSFWLISQLFISCVEHIKRLTSSSYPLTNATAAASSPLAENSSLKGSMKPRTLSRYLRLAIALPERVFSAYIDSHASFKGMSERTTTYS